MTIIYIYIYIYRKKIKSGGFVGAQKQAMNEKEASPDEHTESLAVGPNQNPGTQTPNQAKVSESSEDSSPVGSSRRKLSQHGYRDTAGCDGVVVKTTDFRSRDARSNSKPCIETILKEKKRNMTL